SKALQSLDNYINCPAGKNYSYPNNNFDKVYDINAMRDRLISTRIEHDEILLSALMFLEKDDGKAIDTVKTFNEIVSNFVVVVDNSKNIDTEKIKSVGANVIKLKNMDKKFSQGIKECRGKYVILVDSGEICPFVSQPQIVDILSNNNYEGVNLITVDSLSNEQRNNLKIIKNNKKIMSIEEHKKKLESQNKKIANPKIYLKK
ncbi:MAG: hypothetical protein ACRC3Y_18795, partial [Romboutsia sp.]|uniref:hypothetical protein n=1 Tax=Romboutsia sp. TaxID=1965302 RepID=UPI003F4155F6